MDVNWPVTYFYFYEKAKLRLAFLNCNMNNNDYEKHVFILFYCLFIDCFSWNLYGTVE